VTRSKTIVIAGAPTGCWTNLGDEAIFAGMLRGIRDLEPDVSVIVVSSNPEGALARYGVTEVPYNDVTQIIEAISSSDLMILGGGSIFFDYWGFDPNKALTAAHEGLAFFAGLALLARLLNKPLMIYGAGVGPLLSDDGKRFTRLAFEQAQLSTVRDEESKALLQSLDIDTETVRVTADPAFTLQTLDENRVEEILETEGGKALSRPFVGVALRNWDFNVKPEIWERDVATALDKFVERHGGTVFFVPLHLAVNWPLTDDASVAHRVMNRMKHRTNAVVLEGNYHLEEKAGVFQRCDLVLGMRLHSIIFAIQGAVPPVALSYDPKVSNALAGVGLQEYSVDLSSMTSNSLTGLLERAFKNRTRLRALLGRKRETLADSARENARLATAMINEKKVRAPALSSVTADFLKSPAIKHALQACDLHDAAEELLSQFEKQEKVDSKAGQPDDFGTALEHAKQASIVRSGKSKSRSAPTHKREKPRVACLTNRLLDWETQQPRIGGAERYCLMLGRLFEDLGLDITFYQAGNKGFEGDFFGFKVIALPCGEVFSEFQYGVCDAFFELSADYEHVIYNMANYASGRVREDALMICHGIWFDHNYFEPPFAFRTPEWFEHLYKAFSQPQKIVSVDANAMNVIRSFWPELGERMSYLPNCVDTSIFHPSDRRKSAPVTIIFPRRTERIRGSHLLGPIVDRIPHDCRIWWVGDGEERDNELIRVVTRRDPRVTFSGASFEEMAGLYREADICVIPTVGSEGASLACLEALASGCAVVTTTIGGLPELVHDGVNGILVDPDAGRIAAAINLLIEQPEERFRLQQTAVETARYFDISLWKQRWVKVLEELNWIEPQMLSRNLKETVESESETQIVPHSEQEADRGEKNKVPQTENNLLKDSTPYDVICFSIIEWDFRYQRPQQIVSQFADQGHRVFYFSISEQLPVGDKRYAINKLRDNVWEVQLATPQPIDLHSGKLPLDVARFLTEDLRSLRDEMEITSAISLVQFPTWATTAYAARDAFGWPVIYDCMDNWSTFPGMETLDDLMAQERKLVASADLLVVSSETLWEKWSRLNPNSVLARNAADFTRFHNPQPNDLLADASKPIIGYFGAIAEWFDIDLMIHMVKERPNYTFVVIGDVYGVAMDDLELQPNVRVLGVQPYEQMPAYLLHFDVCIVPFKVNKATEAMDVVKFYEYISQGKAVVATQMRELLGYSSYLYLADDADDFIRKLDLAVLENDANLKEKRIELARRNTWQSRLKLIKAGIERARRRVVTTEMIKILVDLLQEAPGEKSREEGEEWLLKRAVFHLNASLAEREQAVQIMNNRLTDREYKLNALSAQLESTDEIVAARDEAIAWLKGELALFRKETVDVVESNKSLMVEGGRSVLAEASLAEREKQVRSLSAQLSEAEDAVESFSAELAEREKQVQSLSAQLSDRQADIDSLFAEVARRQQEALRFVAEIAHRDRAMEYSSTLLEEKARTILARDQAITWLKGELEELERKNQRSTGSSSFLKMQLAKNETAIKVLQQQLSARDLELERITRSIGWRLLSRYGRIKYRYLLPLYRTLNLLPTETKPSTRQAASASLPAPTVDESASMLAAGPAIGGPAIEQAIAKAGGEDDPAQIERTRNSEESGQFDFYEAVTLLPRLVQEEVSAILDKRPPAEPLHRQDVICFSIVDWESRYQRPQQIMSQFAARGHRVFYISTSRFLPADAKSRVAVKQIKKNVFEIQLAAARMPDVYGEVIDGNNKRALLDSLEELRSTCQINDAIGYAMIASWGAVALDAKLMWGWRTIYDCMDEWENFPGIKRDILDMEQRLVRDCDLLVVTAQRLWEKWEPYERVMVLARNGVDIDFYDKHHHPNNILSEIKHPVVGYYGAIADWFDLELMTHAAKARPDYTFVLLGGVFDLDVSELESLPNVRLLGQQPYETMPQYLYHFDVCMIPFKINPITEATDPVKLYEYLSAGKPVVSVALSEVEDYGEYLYIARDRDDFVAKLDEAVEEDDREMVLRRRKFAEQHTWQQRYKTIEAGIKVVTPRASVIVVSYNNLALNKLCLESIIRNTEYPNYEIIVVDNDSKDGTPAYLRYMAAQYPNISIILNDGNNGFARANNQGIARSSGDYIVLLNNDTIVPPGWLSRLLRHLENSVIGMIGPLTNFVGNEAKLDIDYQTWGEMEAFAARHVWEHDGQSADIYMLAMFCVAFRRDTYDEIGPLDEQFGIGMFEDDDYAQRMKAKGYRVMCAADVFVHHFGQAAFKKLIEDGSYDPLFDENRSYYETKWNIKWTPHKHARLKFERLPHAAPERQAVGKKR
jgi:polysaccharide pyruvyl transferase CsaB